MRALTTAIALTLLPGLVMAQGSRSDPGSLPSIGMPLPQIGLPLPLIGLPLPPAGPTRADGPVARGARPAPDRRQDRGGAKRAPRSPHAIVYVVPAYGNYQIGTPVDRSAREGADLSTQAPALSASAAPNRPSGTLWLDLEPAADAQVYVNGFFIGTIDDAGRELALEAGAHHIEVRAPGYEAMSVNVRIDANRAITYRGTLQPALEATAAAPASNATAAPAAVVRKPFYMIPGCYLGDVPPQEARLPKTCDPARAITMWP